MWSIRAVSFESLHEPIRDKGLLLLNLFRDQPGQCRVGAGEVEIGLVAGRSFVQGDVSCGEPGALATGDSHKDRSVLEDGINAAKLLRACGGCLGVRRR